MLRTVTLFMLLLLATATARGAEEDANYTYGISSRDGLAMTRHARPEYADTLREARPDCIVVNWIYAAPAGSTQRDLQEEGERANAAVDDETSGSPDAVVVAKTVTVRESVWIIYSASGPQLAAGIERRMSALSGSTSSVRHERDPDWRIFASYLARLRE
ncbi:MAG TPA: hypothetical protein VHP37_26280 [Burkholderiales bacterium]|nr:hypothetical protein [Burkholderiales bacterium]